MKHCKIMGILLAGTVALGCIDAGSMMFGTGAQAAELTKEVTKSKVKIPDTYKGSVTLNVAKDKITISGGKRMKSLSIDAWGGTIKEIKFANRLERLKEFNVYMTTVKKIDLGMLPNLEKIATGSGGTISNAKKGLLKLNGLRKLKEISFANYTSAKNPLSVMNCKSLKSVSYSGTKVSIRNCPKVKSVTCTMGKASIKNSPNIVSIDLGTDGKVSLKDLYGCRKLKKLVAGKSIIKKLNKSKLPKLKKIVNVDEASDE